MTNLGASPIDTESPIGQVRLILGDTNATPLEPPLEGYASFDWFSDAEIGQFVLSGSGSNLRAVGLAIKQLATGAALKGYAIKTDDLSVDASKRGTSLLDIAQSYLADADALDAANSSDFFQVIPFGGYSESPSRVEGQLAPYGWPTRLV